MVDGKVAYGNSEITMSSRRLSKTFPIPLFLPLFYLCFLVVKLIFS